MANSHAKLNLIRSYYRWGALILLVLFSAVQFILILRHKSPYLSDSYFYKHIFYQLQGKSFNTSYQIISSQVDLKNADPIIKNIFQNKDAYKNSYTLFTKRPLYPLLAYLLNVFVNNEYFAFLTPVFFAYLGVIILVFYLSSFNLSHFLATIVTALFVSFYPYLDWSTYFLTDTIGAFFWLLGVLCLYKFFSEKKSKWFIFYQIMLPISLLNREQGILMVPLLAIFYFLMVIFGFNWEIRRRTLRAFVYSVLVVILYFAASTILKQRNLIDTLVYTKNSYGLFQYRYSPSEIFFYLISQIKIAHAGFAGELIRHHWWFLLTAIGIIGVAKTFLFSKRAVLADALVISSGLASYLSIFLYPVLSYRYFFPLLFTILFFAIKLVDDFFKQREATLG